MASLLRTLLRPIAIRGLQLQEWRASGGTWNPLSPAVYRNPYPEYAEPRTKDSVHWSPLLEAWVVTRYAEADAILRDHKRYSNDPRGQQRRRGPRAAGIE